METKEYSGAYLGNLMIKWTDEIPEETKEYSGAIIPANSSGWLTEYSKILIKNLINGSLDWKILSYKNPFVKSGISAHMIICSPFCSEMIKPSTDVIIEEGVKY